MFTSIQIQTIHGCNLKCSFCPNSYIKQTGDKMKWELYLKIISELQELEYKGRVAPYLMNEPLLDNRMLGIAEYTRCMLPDSEIMISTNGTLLKDKKEVDSLIRMGFNKIIVSCYTKKIYNKVKDWNVDPIKFYERDLQKQFYNRGGNSKGYGGKVEQKYCKNPFQQIYITTDGKAVICCADYKKEVVMGDINKSSLLDIWNNDKYNYYRNHLEQGNRKELKLCKYCNY